MDGWIDGGKLDRPVQWYVCISFPSRKRWKTLFWLLILVHSSLTIFMLGCLGAMMEEVCLSFGFQKAKKEREEEEVGSMPARLLRPNP